MNPNPNRLMPAIALTDRAERWVLKTRELKFGNNPLPILMGIVNVTPDSFSDGGQFFDSQTAIDHALRLVDQGAGILDIGGESTRPYSTPVDANEELGRVIPVIDALTQRVSIPISIDTSKAIVASEALAAGAEIVNDVTGLEGDPGMIQVVIDSGCGVCAMHMQGTPQTMQDSPTYIDVVEDILNYLRSRRDTLLAAGISPGKICLDPGIGFGKSHEHNIELAANCFRYHELGCPLLVGHSRKGFIGKLIGDKEANRLPGTIGVSVSLAFQGVQLLRVHDVGPIRQALLACLATVPSPR